VCTSDTILVVYNYFGTIPLRIDANDGITEIDNFKFDDNTGTIYACSTTINGKMMIFGGKDPAFTSQISVVDSDCALRRIGDLPIRYYFGACNTYDHEDGERTMICFGEDEKNGCLG